MAMQTVEALVNGGKASAGPPLGPALGPMGVNIGQVISEINKKTAAFAGMQVPVKVNIDTTSKDFTISVGTPPASALIIKEAGIEKGSGAPNTDKVADILIEQIIKIAKMKEDSLLGKNLKSKMKEIIGTCNSMGVMVEGVPAVDAIKLVNEGKFDAEIKSEKTELTQEELKKLDEERKRLAEEVTKRRAELEATAKAIMTELAGKERAVIKARLVAAKIPDIMIKELLPVDAAAGAAGEKKPAAAAPEKK